MPAFRQAKKCISTILVFLVLCIFTNSQAQGLIQKYGILGKAAPTLVVQAWVDKQGVASDPVLLSDFKGKVVYLLFFQDW